MPVRSAIYLDSNATAPLAPRAADDIAAILREPLRSGLSNPSSIHSHGQKAKRLLALARESVVATLGRNLDLEQLVFTSSGTESNQLAIRSALEPLLLAGKKPHWILSSVEHDSVLQMQPWLEAQGGSVSVLPVDSEGRHNLDLLAEFIRPETALISLVWVNNETGVVSDVAGLIQIAQAQGVAVHLDAAQAWGKLAIDLNKTPAQWVSFSGHKIGALSGIGALWVGRGRSVRGTVLGKQEKARRGGTENTLGIVSLGAAARSLANTQELEKITALRDELQRAICERIPDVSIHGGKATRVGNTLCFSVGGIEGDGLVMALDLEGFSVSAGSACSSGAMEPSHVLLAMGKTKAQALSALRISLSRSNTAEELSALVDALEKVVIRFRRNS